LDRAADFGQAEREEPELLFELLPGHSASASDRPFNWPAPTAWHGTPNRLDRHPMYRWPVLDEVAAASQTIATNKIAAYAYSISARGLKQPQKQAQMPAQGDILARRSHSAATLIR
ncbi:MAG: hypothetical protein FD135_4471, partial [Comamonadaceae bacterium]